MNQTEVPAVEVDKLAEKIIDAIDSRLRANLTVDYTPRDISRMTGYSAKGLCALTIHGEYRVGGKRMFRREVVDYRRKMGLNLAQGWD